MTLINEFKSFVVRGNVMDMAVGIIMGVAFGKVISSFVNDVVMPPLGVLIGGVHFGDLVLVLKEAHGEVAAVTLNYGAFIQNIIDFLIIGLAIFVAVKIINQLQRKEEVKQETAPDVPSNEEKLLTEIRDLLESGRQESSR
ncbi:MAG: large-conductance mechanosensitive channel protein MscL [Gammaproteobacteria bacterium]